MRWRAASRAIPIVRRPPTARSSTPPGARRAGCASPSCASRSAASRSIRCWSLRSSGRPSCWRSLGHHVEEAAPDYDAAATGAAFGTVMCANTWTNIQVRAGGRVPGPDDLEPVTRLYAERGAAGERPRLHPRRPDLPSHRARSSAPSSRSTTCCCRRRLRAPACRSARCAWTAALESTRRGSRP